MKSEKNILIAFILNLGFSVFELIGGMLTGSVAIASDAVHDLGDAVSIGASYFLEKKSHRAPDEQYTYGYARYSVIGSFVTVLILMVGSIMVTVNAVGRIIHPTEIDYDGMLIFAVIGVVVNLCAAFFTRDGESINQRAVNLHMLEDVLGWGVVLIGAIVMRLTDFALLDPILSIGVAIYIFWHAIGHLSEILELFLEKTPHGVDVSHLREHLCEIEGVVDVHHVHVWSLDGNRHYATMHVVASGNAHDVKHAIREELVEHGIAHVTIEVECDGEECSEHDCQIQAHAEEHHRHHHHHHHH